MDELEDDAEDDVELLDFVEEPLALEPNRLVAPRSAVVLLEPLADIIGFEDDVAVEVDEPLEDEEALLDDPPPPPPPPLLVVI